MGKHDKVIQMNWDEDAGESYTQAENRRLRSENEKLRARVKSLEKEGASKDSDYKKLNELAIKTMQSKDRTIERLERKILSLVNDYV